MFSEFEKFYLGSPKGILMGQNPFGMIRLYTPLYVRALRNEIAEKDKTIANLRKQLEMEKQRADTAIRKIDDLAEQNKAVLSLIAENAKTLAFHKKIRESKGSKSPNYIEGIDNTQLVQDYINAGYNLRAISDEYSEKYKITYGALRLRLINAGVWKAKS